MTDEKKPDDLEDMDWDSALSDWESKNFVPEVAREVVTDKPAVLPSATASRPLYKPPKVSPAKPKLAPPPPDAAPPSQNDLGEEEATVIGAIPRELLSDIRPRVHDLTKKRPPTPQARSGGLGQLFARDDRREPPSSRRPDASQSATRARSELGEGVVTSAPPVSPRSDRSGVATLRRPASLDKNSDIADPNKIDSFPEARAEQLTILAEGELGELLDEADDARETPHADLPSSLAPETRRYDPEDETLLGDRSALFGASASIADSERARSEPPLTPSTARPPEQAAPARLPDVVPVTPAPEERAWQDERPASEWLDEPTRDSLRGRAEWLEEESRLAGDTTVRGRGLLVCSEILASIGDRDRALALATEARDLAPSIALAHRQARALMPMPMPDAASAPGAGLEALDFEIKMTPVGPAQTHAALLAAAAAAEGGDGEAAAQRLEQAAQSAPGDVRVAIGLAARALARPDAAAPSGRTSGHDFGQGRDAATIANALKVCLRLRGAEVAEVGARRESPNELLMRARNALDKGDVSAASTAIHEVSGVPELASGALWLAAALGATRRDRRTQAAGWLGELVERGDEEARRPLAARALELADGDLLAELVAGPGALLPAERLVLATLSSTPAAIAAGEAYVSSTADALETRPLASAAAAVGLPVGLLSTSEERHAERARERAKRTVGSPESRFATELGRMLGAGAPAADVEAVLDALGTAAAAPMVRAVSLEIAARMGRVAHLSETLAAWGAARGSDEDAAIGALAAAIVAERAGDGTRALEGFKAARAADGTCEAALRAIAALEPVDMVAEMNTLADELGEGPRAAIARLEAVALGERVLPEPTQAHLLEAAHRAAPSLPMAGFLAERIARRAGDLEEVLRWIRDRRSQSTDSTESALDAVREAFLVADSDPVLAAERLREAHSARPEDVALRDLFERTAIELPHDRAAWREGCAADAEGDARKLLLLEAAFEYEQDGDDDGALRCAERAAALDTALGRLARERAEMRTGRVARIADELFAEAKATSNPIRRREAFERLADLDRDARHDPGSAVLWHRMIFEELPGSKASLRYLEQHLVGEGRDEELEPIASGIAMALRGTDSAETVAHAELAARLRMRGAAGSWESTRDIVEVAASEKEPSLWALRMLQSHSRSSGDDATFLDVTKRLVERATRPLESAALLLRAAECAARLGNASEARALLERAVSEDPADIVSWELLVRTREEAGDRHGAAEASQAVARTSVVAERQLAAWYEAGTLWQDTGEGTASAPDEDRALIAFEAAAAIDVTYKDLFERLSRIYAGRKMQPELAELLERRIECVTDPEERLAVEIQRGRVLFSAGDVEGARRAYASALAQRPDGVQALSALTDLCLAQKDWEVAEQSLIRLARLLSTPAEQRVVYTQLAEIYTHHLVNLSRAEVALKEVFKCAPDDVETSAKLVEVYKRQQDAPRAVELQEQLIQKSRSPEDKRRRVVELALIHEEIARDNRKAEQTLESARREFPQDVEVLRALAQFYKRHSQTPAVNILLDRAATDARRALTAGRLTATSFEVLTAVFDLRGLTDAARVSQAMLAALEGRPAEMRGAGVEAAFDTKLDDVLAPEALNAPLRGLLAKTGDALDAVNPVDLRALKATPIAADGPVARLVARAAAAAGLGNVALLASAKLGAICIPTSTSPPTIVIGQALVADERIGGFLALRALKLLSAKAAVLGRTVPGELGVIVSAWLKCFNPSWEPQGINAAALGTALARIQSALPAKGPGDVRLVALEVAGSIGTRQATLGPAALAWANRVAFLALGDPNAALDAIASAGAPGSVGVAGPPRTAPLDAKERAAWVARTPEARDLVAFALTDAFAEARARLGLDRGLDR